MNILPCWIANPSRSTPSDNDSTRPNWFRDDGVRSLLDLSKLSGLEFGAVRRYIDDFVEAGIAAKGGLNW